MTADNMVNPRHMLAIVTYISNSIITAVLCSVYYRFINKYYMVTCMFTCNNIVVKVWPKILLLMEIMTKTVGGQF